MNDDLKPLAPRTGTIVWGCILLVVAAIAISASQLDFGDVSPTVFVWSVIAFGAVLVLAGIATAIVRAAMHRPGASDSENPAATAPVTAPVSAADDSPAS